MDRVIACCHSSEGLRAHSSNEKRGCTSFWKFANCLSVRARTPPMSALAWWTIVSPSPELSTLTTGTSRTDRLFPAVQNSNTSGLIFPFLRAARRRLSATSHARCMYRRHMPPSQRSTHVGHFRKATTAPEVWVWGGRRPKCRNQQQGQVLFGAIICKSCPRTMDLSVTFIGITLKSSRRSIWTS